MSEETIPIEETAVPLIHLGRDSDAVSPRLLVRWTYEMSAPEEPDQTAYEAINAWRCFGKDGDRYDEAILGYAELPMYQNVGRFLDFDEFRSHIESKAIHVYWKPRCDYTGIVGSGDPYREADDE